MVKWHLPVAEAAKLLLTFLKLSLFSWFEIISRLGACVMTLGRAIDVFGLIGEIAAFKNVEPGNGSR